MNKKQYFHELSQREIDLLLTNGATVGFIAENLLQPDWCNYPGALNGRFGCWSLTDIKPGGQRTKICVNFCCGCDCFDLSKR